MLFNKELKERLRVAELAIASLQNEVRRLAEDVEEQTREVARDLEELPSENEFNVLIERFDTLESENIEITRDVETLRSDLDSALDANAQFEEEIKELQRGLGGVAAGDEEVIAHWTRL